MHRNTRTLTTALTALAIALVIAPAATADRPDDRAGTIGVGSVTAQTPDVVRPDDRAGLRGPGAAMVSTEQTVSAVTRPDDRSGVRGPGAVPGAPTILVSNDGGFDWSDAGIGLAGGLGLALLVAGLLSAAMHRRRIHPVA